MDASRFLILTVSFVCLANQALARMIPQPRNVTDLVAFKLKLDSVLNNIEWRKFDIVKIIEATQTEFGGTIYKAKFINIYPPAWMPGGGDVEHCKVSWTETIFFKDHPFEAFPKDLVVDCQAV